MITYFKNETRSAIFQEEREQMGIEHSRARLSNKASRSGSAASEYQWECPYCKGVGIDPYNTTGIRNCPACHGRIFWEADVKSLALELCDVCEGTGKTNFRGSWQVCPTCQGAGRG
jgi:DnaJ-class molecular chaperone